MGGAAVPVPDEAVVAKLRDAFATAVMSEGDGEPVPSETIWRALDGDLSPELSQELADRLAHDPDLRQEWRLAMELHRSAQRADQSAVQTGSEGRPLAAKVVPMPSIATPPSRLPRRVLPLAAAIATIALVASLVVRFQAPPASGPDTGQVMRSGSDLLLGLDPVEDLPPCLPDGCSLRWQGIDAAQRYELDVTTEDLKPVYSRRDLREPEAGVPASVLAALDGPQTLLWQVTARLETGETIRSRTHRIQFE